MTDLAWSPDGRRLAFAGRDGEEAQRIGRYETNLYVLDLAGLVESPPS